MTISLAGLGNRARREINRRYAMEQTTLEEAAKAFADAQEKETAARDHHAHCLSLVEKSMNDSVEASTARHAAERQLLKAACVGANEPK